MKWKIIIEIEGNKPTEKQIADAKTIAEEAVLEILNPKVKFINTRAINGQ